MLYGDKNCFASLRDWFGTVEVYWTNLERLFMVADYAKKQNPSVAEKIATCSKRIVELFHQTKDYASYGILNTKKNTSFPQRIIQRLQTKVGIH